MASAQFQMQGMLPPEINLAAERGWRLLPIRARDKAPLVKAWPQVATSDISQLEAWAEQYPACNWGVATGQASDTFVLDVDGSPGKAALKAYQQQGWELPKTLTVKTGRGGHLYFRWPQGLNIRSNAGKLAKGLDVRGNGGCAVIPPSVHSSGKQYAFVDPDAAIAEAPAWLLNLLREPPPSPTPVTATTRRVIPEGTRTNTLISLAGTMRSKGMAQKSIDAALLMENQERSEKPLTDAQVLDVASRYESESKADKPTRRPDVICLANVEAKPIEWFWEPYIPFKMLTLFSGDPGAGKTALALALAAALTQGKAFFKDEPTTPANVLYLSEENSPEQVLRPRFDALKGDPSRFFLLRGTLNADDTQGGITLSDTQQLEDAIRTNQARLVVIDPLQSYLGARVDSHKASETRPVLDGLIRLAERTGCAIVITRHLSKGIGGSATYRGMGSIDFTAAVRCELFIAKDPENQSGFIMAHAKTNLSILGPSLAFSIGESAVVKLCGESRLSANDLLIPPVTSAERSAIEAAEDFLREALAAGPKPSEEIKEQAKSNGVSIASLRRAQKNLKVRPKPSGFGKEWTWELPRVAQESPEMLKAEG